VLLSNALSFSSFRVDGFSFPRGERTFFHHAGIFPDPGPRPPALSVGVSFCPFSGDRAGRLFGEPPSIFPPYSAVSAFRRFFLSFWARTPWTLLPVLDSFPSPRVPTPVSIFFDFLGGRQRVGNAFYLIFGSFS